MYDTTYFEYGGGNLEDVGLFGMIASLGGSGVRRRTRFVIEDGLDYGQSHPDERHYGRRNGGKTCSSRR